MSRKSLLCRLPWVAVLLAAVMSAGCGSSGPPRAPIHGSVTAAGQPLAAGRILFTPVAPNKGPATTARITNGKYELPEANGPVVGKNKVQIEADLNLGFELDDEAAFAQRGGAPLPPSPIPAEFGIHSVQMVEVKADEDNAYDVTIPAAQQMTAGAYGAY